MTFTISTFRAVASVVLFATGLITLGIYVGSYCVERDEIRRTLDDSMLQIAKNLEAIKYIQAGKTSNAIDLINANNEEKLLYLMRYDDVASGDIEFLLRKRKVLSNLKKELSERVRDNANINSYTSSEEWKDYQSELKIYLEKETMQPSN